MEEIFVDLRKYDLCNELKKDYISIDELLNILEDKIYEIKYLEDKIIELGKPKEPPCDYEDMS